MLHVVVKKAMYLESNNDDNNDYNHSNTSKYFHNTFCVSGLLLNALCILTCLIFTTTSGRCYYELSLNRYEKWGAEN